MSYNKTLLYSANTTTSTINLPEPLSAFERYVVKVNPGVYWESVCTGDRSVQRYNRYGSYQTDGYMEWPANWVISNGTQTMNCNRFQLLFQQGTTNSTRTFGWNNTAGNILSISEVWGINRKEPIATDGSGKPQGDGWKTYDETLLWSGDTYPEHIDLSGRALEYERIKVGVGSFGESTNVYEVDAPQTYTSWLPLRSYWGSTTGSFYLSMHRYKWDNETSGLSAVAGKTWQLGTGAANPYTTTGNYTGSDVYIRRPVWAIWGVNHKKSHNFITLTSEGGTLSANRLKGYENDIGTISVTPSSDEWRQSALNVTGATFTGDEYKFEDTNITAQAEFEHTRDLTLVNSEHGTLSADRLTGFSGDIVNIDATTEEGWYLSSIAVTGAEATGLSFMFTGSDVTAEGEYTDVGFPITYLSDEHVSCTGDVSIYVPGGTGITLQTGYDTYYRISGYDVTGGTVENGILYPTGACIVKAVEKLNTFTATGGWEKGSNVEAVATSNVREGDATVAQKYAIHGSHTGEVPAAWYSSSNRWKVTTPVSAYSITLKPIITVQCTGTHGSNLYYATACSYVGSTSQQSQTFSRTGNGTFSYNKNFSVSNTGVNYGVSAHIHTWAYDRSTRQYATARYVANGTSGTWEATGIIP